MMRARARCPHLPRVAVIGMTSAWLEELTATLVVRGTRKQNEQEIEEAISSVKPSRLLKNDLRQGVFLFRVWFDV